MVLLYIVQRYYIMSALMQVGPLFIFPLAGRDIQCLTYSVKLNEQNEGGRYQSIMEVQLTPKYP
jgi:hypothetical protein